MEKTLESDNLLQRKLNSAMCHHFIIPLAGLPGIARAFTTAQPLWPQPAPVPRRSTPTMFYHRPLHDLSRRRKSTYLAKFQLCNLKTVRMHWDRQRQTNDPLYRYRLGKECVEKVKAPYTSDWMKWHHKCYSHIIKDYSVHALFMYT